MILAEALTLDPYITCTGQKLHCARVLHPNSHKYGAMQEILHHPAVAYFIGLHQMLDQALDCRDPLVIVTDWSDPCEVVGLRLETEQGTRDFPNLCFLALETNWENLHQSRIERIFSHELSHLWLHRMGFQPALSHSNRFHTSTAITDPYLAFLEGFAEHLEIVSEELIGDEETGDFYDNGYDLGAWLCARDSALRIHAVKNNRFLYLTAVPEQENFDSYQQLHMAHITSSAFLPERLKNGLQAISSEGLIASFFYQMYHSQALRQSRAPAEVYARFHCTGELDPVTNLYIKILWAMLQIDLRSPKLFTDFVAAYENTFEEDRSVILEVFGKVTNFVTVDRSAQQLFGTLYRIGRQGNPDELVRFYKQTEPQKSTWIRDLHHGLRHLDDAVYPSLWIETDKQVLPVPWDPAHKGTLKIDVNAATDVDFFAIDGLTFPQCQELVKIREETGGFSDLKTFYSWVDRTKAC